MLIWGDPWGIKASHPQFRRNIGSLKAALTLTTSLLPIHTLSLFFYLPGLGVPPDQKPRGMHMVSRNQVPKEMRGDEEKVMVGQRPPPPPTPQLQPSRQGCTTTGPVRPACTAQPFTLEGLPGCLKMLSESGPGQLCPIASFWDPLKLLGIIWQVR